MGKYRTIFVVGVMAFIANGLYRTPGSPHVDGLITIISICAISGAIVGKITSWALQRQKNSVEIKRPSQRYQRSQVKTRPTTTDAKVTTTETSTSDKDYQEYIITTAGATKVATTKTPTSDTSNKPRTRPKPNIQHQSEFVNVHHSLIVLDTSVILDAIGFNNDNDQNKRAYDFLVPNKERIKVPKTAMDEAKNRINKEKERILKMQDKMKLFDGKEVESCSKVIENVDEMNERASDYVNSPLNLGTSLILEVIDFNNNKDRKSERAYDFLKKNKEKIKVVKSNKSDVEKMLLSMEANTLEMKKKRMELFDGKVVNSDQEEIKKESYKKAIKNVTDMHKCVCDDVDSNIANKWIDFKKGDLKNFDEKLDSESVPDYKLKQLKYLIVRAKPDRKIMAEALVLAEQEGVILISNDYDFTLFSDKLSEIATHQLQVGHTSSIPER